MSGGTVTKSSAATAVTIGGGVTTNSLTTDGGTGTANLNGGTFTAAGVFRVGQNLITGSVHSSNGISFPKWTGAVDGTWDATTPNWSDLLTSLPSEYVDGVPVLFDATATMNTAIEASGTSLVNFNGGVLKAAAGANTAFLGGLDATGITFSLAGSNGLHGAGFLRVKVSY